MESGSCPAPGTEESSSAGHSPGHDSTRAGPLALTPQSAQRVGEITASLTDFMQPLNDIRPANEMISFDMAVDEEVSIPAYGKCSQSQASLGGVTDELFFSAASGSYSMELSQPAAQMQPMEEEPVLMPIGTAQESAGVSGSISKESMPQLVEEKPALLISQLPPLQEAPNTPRRRSITDMDAMQEVDPHGLIAFSSPSRFPNRTLSSAQLAQQAGLSLLDVDIMASPQSLAKYSQRDFDRLKGEFERRAEKQAEFMQFELQALQERYETSLQANNELRVLVAEYENTMGQLLEARKQKGDQLATIEQLLQDKRRLHVDLHTAQVAYQNLHARYEEVKALNEQLRVHEQSLKANISGLQAELSNADRRFEALRQHAESKLQEANGQLQRVQSTMDVELSAVKAKLLKAELRIGSLEEALASKTRENKELGAICDELIQKIDPSAAPASVSTGLSLAP